MRDEPGTTTPEARRQVMRAQPPHRRAPRRALLCAHTTARRSARTRSCATATASRRSRTSPSLPEHRGTGLGRLVTSAALAAGLALEPELLFIVADDEDWPKELYERLGFEPAGRIRGFLRPPPVRPGGRRAGLSALRYASVRRPPAKSRASRR